MTDDIFVVEFSQPVENVMTKRSMLLLPVLGSSENVCKLDDTWGLNCGKPKEQCGHCWQHIYAMDCGNAFPHENSFRSGQEVQYVISRTCELALC